MVTVVILLGVLARMYSNGGNKFSNVRSFIILLSEEGLTSFSTNNRTNFLGEKKCKIKLSGVSLTLLVIFTPTFKPVLQQIRLLKVAKTFCRK